MNIILNGEAHDLLADTLAGVLDELGYQGAFATALNGRFVPQAERANTLLAPGDRLEVVAPMQGG